MAKDKEKDQEEKEIDLETKRQHIEEVGTFVRNREFATYKPFKSSYSLPYKICGSINYARTQDPRIPRKLNSDIKFREDSFGFRFYKENAGTILNTFENMELTTMWDVREDADFSTVVLGRPHMFYSAEGVPIAYTNEYGMPIDALTNIRIELKILNPLNFLNEVNEKLVNDINAQELYDSITYIDYKEEETEILTNELEKNLERNGVRKFSENHFVISGYNLLFQEIKVNNNVPNTVTIKGNFNEDQKMKEFSYLSIFDLSKSAEESVFKEFYNKYVVPVSVSEPSILRNRSVAILLEYMSTFLIKQIEYCYSGKIFMKYNPAIELGDTITLIDEINSTIGVFRVDSFEHSLDTRGLITIANVKACFDFRDPLLDTYAKKIGSELLEEFNKTIDKEYVSNMKIEDGIELTPKNKTIAKIIEYYLKFLSQSPKYTMLYHHIGDIVINAVQNTKGEKNIFTPTPVPLRFIPMFVKGKIQIPESLKYAFFWNEKNNYSSFLKAMYYHFILALDKCIIFLGDFGLKSIYFVLDFIFSTFTMGLHELFKPIFGISKRKMFKQFVKTEDLMTSSEEVKSMQKYNPYTGGVNSDTSLKLCFFNIQMRHTDDIKKEGFDIDESIKSKEWFINEKLLGMQNKNVLFLVELYNSFNYNGYNCDKFLSNIKVNKENKNKYELISDNDFVENGAVIVNDPEGAIESINTTSAPFTISGRNVMETTIKINSKYFRKSSLEMGVNRDYVYSSVYGENPPDNIKVIWFHNINGASEDVIKGNIDKVLKYYTEEYNGKENEDKTKIGGKKTGYVIMADCNVEIVNYNNSQILSKGSGKNFYYKMFKNMPFRQLVTKPTTLDSKSNSVSRLLDNLLVSDNLKSNVNLGFTISGNRYDYAYDNGKSGKNKKMISDHLPIYLDINFKP